MFSISQSGDSGVTVAYVGIIKGIRNRKVANAGHESFSYILIPQGMYMHARL